MKKARTNAQESIMIGDSSEIDILGAQSVGMDNVHVNYNHKEQTIKPTYTIYHLKELQNIL